jgi:hypothetical protein
MRWRRVAVGAVLVASLVGTRPEPAEAQAVPAAYGLITGTISGVYMTTGIFVTKARLGSYLYSLDEAFRLRWELAPIVLMPIGSVAVGIDDGQRLARSIKYGSVGFALGALAGFGVSALVIRAEGREDEWASTVIGSAAGLLAGSLYGALSYEDDGAGGGGPGFPIAFSVKVPF